MNREKGDTSEATATLAPKRQGVAIRTLTSKQREPFSSQEERKSCCITKRKEDAGKTVGI